MTATLGGDDPHHDLGADEKDRIEAELRREALALLRLGDHRELKRRLARANEISRPKSKRAHRGRD